ARYVETTNAYNPAEHSVAQLTHEAVVLKGAKDILYDCVEAPPLVSVKGDDEEVLEALRIAYGDASWVDLESILAAIRDPRTPEHDAYRFYFNQIRETVDTWIPQEVWEKCRDDLSPIRPGDQISIGFDGSLYDDNTAMIGCRLSDGKLFVLGVWDPEDSGGGVGLGAVNKAMRDAFSTSRVAGVYAGPYYWQDVVGRGSVEVGGKVAFKFPTDRV